MQALLDDHTHMKMALDVLDNQHTVLIHGDRPNVDLMLNIIVYLQEYSEQVHHPAEDAIFSLLLTRDASTGEALRDLISDHTRMST